MNLQKLTFLCLALISIVIAFTQPNSKLIFAELGYGSEGYGNDPAGYSFDPTGYGSPTLVYYDGPETSGKNVGLDTRVVPFASLNWDAAITLIDSPEIFLQELVQDDHSYKSTIYYGLDSAGFYTIVTSLLFSIDDQAVLSAENLHVPREPFVSREGVELMVHLLAAGEIIKGGSVSDTLYGFNGDDSLRGNDGDDILNGGWGINYLSGGDGIDTAVYDYDDADYILSKNPIYGFVEMLVKWGGSLGIVLDDVEKLQFRNTTRETAELNYWGTYSFLPPNSSIPVMRFFNTVTQSFFYTSSVDEAAYILELSSVNRGNVEEAAFAYQGSTFEAAHSYGNAVGLHLFYNTSSGTHFFTANSAEADFLNSQIANANIPFSYQGIAFNVYQTDPNPGASGQEVAVYHFYNPDLDRHFWSADDSEIVLMNASGKWINEGVAFYGERLGK